MHTVSHRLLAPSPGTARELVSLHYGPEAGTGTGKALIQASLHADEVPGMLVAHHLRDRLAALEAQGRLAGEVVLVPAANPIGLSQGLLQRPLGRFEAASGENFNRHYPDVFEAIAAAVGPRLGGDAAANVAVVRQAAREAVSACTADTELRSLRKTLLGLGLDADVVLDLHCDHEAVMHLYTTPALWPQADPLARLLGAQAVLLAERSGDDPFDEACSTPWQRLAERFPARPLPAACLAVTVELRGEADVSHAQAARDAQAIVDFLAWRGLVDAPRPELPPAACEPTPLAGSLPVVAPHGGVLVFAREPGERLARGDVVAELIDPLTGRVTPLPSPADGVLYAREHRRFATAGLRVAKVAGREAVRTGKLLSS